MQYGNLLGVVRARRHPKLGFNHLRLSPSPRGATPSTCCISSGFPVSSPLPALSNYCCNNDCTGHLLNI